MNCDESTIDSDEMFDDSPPADLEAASSLLVEFDPITDSVTERIVMAVAGIEDTSATAIDPLYDAVDTEALDRITRSVATRSGPGNAEVVIRYREYTVSVHSHGVIEIASPAVD